LDATERRHSKKAGLKDLINLHYTKTVLFATSKKREKKKKKKKKKKNEKKKKDKEKKVHCDKKLKMLPKKKGHKGRTSLGSHAPKRKKVQD